MKMDDLKLPKELLKIIKASGVEELRPSQKKAIKAGLLENKNLLVCTPTASGKTLIAEIAIMKNIMERRGKGIYIVPLKALGSEKYKDFKKKYEGHANVALSIGDLDKTESYLGQYDIIVATSEKLDSLIRHHTPWLADVATIVVDEVHLLNDPGRGPTLEILLTILKEILPKAQIIALSATIGNPTELANWLEAELVEDTWRPVKLEKGIYGKKLEFYNT